MSSVDKDIHRILILQKQYDRMLVGVRGEGVKEYVLRYALSVSPCVFVDGANCANPFRYGIVDDCLRDVFVVQAELLYTIRDTLRELPSYMNRCGVSRAVVSSFDRVFNYHDELENTAVFTQCWDTLRVLGRSYDIVAGIGKGHHEFSSWCDVVLEVDMGHTVWSQRVTADALRKELLAYTRALRAEEREAFERLLGSSLKTVGPMTYASSVHAWAFLLLSALRDVERRVEALEVRRRVSDEE